MSTAKTREKWPVYTHDEAQALYNRHKTLRGVAEAVDRSAGTVMKKFKELGVEMVGHGKMPDLGHVLYLKREAGWSYQRIGERYGATGSTAQYWYDKAITEGWSPSKPDWLSEDD